ncbi:MAG: nuclear transport factor 2 family protein [Pyrinomonadaceae bacterium]
MTDKKFTKFIIMTLSTIILMCSSYNIHAEAILVKGEAEYLGWINPGNKANFISCYGKQYDIGSSDKTFETSDKCEKSQRLEENRRRGKLGLELLIIDDVKTERSIITFQDYIDAVRKRDKPMVNELLAKEFTSISPNGTVNNKTEFLNTYDNFFPSTVELESLKIIDQKVQMYDKTAVVITTYELTKKTSTDEDTIQNVYNITIVKKDGRWQIVTAQKSEITQSTPKIEQVIKP